MESLGKVVLQSEDIVTSQRVKEGSDVRIGQDAQWHDGAGVEDVRVCCDSGW